jgi:cyanophycin synthetase
VSTGGNCYDVTDQVSDSVKGLALRILEILDIPYVGIDLICHSISEKLTEYVVCELNGAPGLSLHMMPEKGLARNTAGALVDLIFSETTP